MRAHGGRGGLTFRVLVAGALLSLLIGGAFAGLVGAIRGVRDAASLARHSERVLAMVADLERLTVDLESGERGFVATGNDVFLQPWTNARARFAPQAEQLQHLAAVRSASQGRRAAEIVKTGDSYIRNYSDPVVAAARKDPASVRTTAITLEGKRHMDGMRGQFREFKRVEHGLADERDRRADDAVSRAVAVAVAGIGGSVLLIVVFSAYLTRRVARPVVRASRMASKLADGDLAVRMPEAGGADVGRLERSFNTMAYSLETHQDQLDRIVQEQAALRMVATLVARGVPSAEVFNAVASEVGHLFKAQYAAIRRYESCDSAVVVGAWTERPGGGLPVGSHWELRGKNVSTIIRRTGRAMRMSTSEGINGEIGEWAIEHGINFAVGAPITVEGRLWGVMVAFWTEREIGDADIEERMGDFTALVATAIANAQSRAELTESRARVVAAGDAARRRIERDLHDGTQQRLITLALELRMLEADVPAEFDGIRDRLSKSTRDLTGVVDDLREISRGIHPAILSKGGLGAALNALARRSLVPVVIRVEVGRPLGESVEVAAYYVVSEALTNAAKHANASQVEVDITTDEEDLLILIHDDGTGGADPARGSGLIGLRDRVEAVGGRIDIDSPKGGGTTVTVRAPLGS